MVFAGWYHLPLCRQFFPWLYFPTSFWILYGCAGLYIVGHLFLLFPHIIRIFHIIGKHLIGMVIFLEFFFGPGSFLFRHQFGYHPFGYAYFTQLQDQFVVDGHGLIQNPCMSSWPGVFFSWVQLVASSIVCLPWGLLQILLIIFLMLPGAYDKVPNFFRMGTFIDNTHMKL